MNIDIIGPTVHDILKGGSDNKYVKCIYYIIYIEELTTNRKFK